MLDIKTSPDGWKTLEQGYKELVVANYTNKWLRASWRSEIVGFSRLSKPSLHMAVAVSSEEMFAPDSDKAKADANKTLWDKVSRRKKTKKKQNGTTPVAHRHKKAPTHISDQRNKNENNPG